MKGQLWRWVQQVPDLLAAPRPEPTHRVQRILALQRNIVLPAKLVVLSVVFYYLYFTRWKTLGELDTSYGVVLETMQSLFGPYLLINVAAAASFYIVRGYPLHVVQWVVFAIGLVDGFFLGGLTTLTGGFSSLLYWAFPGMIVLNALCIPLAMPQLVLNLSLSAFFLGAGLLELNLTDVETVATLPGRPTTRTNPARLPAGSLPDIDALTQQLKQQSDAASRLMWGRLSEATQSKVKRYQGKPEEKSALETAIAEDLTRRVYIPALPSEPGETPGEPFVLRLFILWLFAFCCYGVQLLSARQQLAADEEMEFVARTEQLRTAGRMAAEIAHKLKNPLAIMSNAVFSLQRAARENRPPAPQQIQIIQEEVDRSDRILTELMGYAKLNEGRVAKLDVAEELNRAVALVLPPAVGYSVEVNREFAPNLPPLWMQPGHFNEIFVNILQNAREAVHGVGSIRVAARARNEHGVEVVIADNGPGIPAERLQQIFEAYFTTREKGTGLGLAIAKHNVELYGGTIRAESVLGQGARFTVFFPARTAVNLST